MSTTLSPSSFSLSDGQLFQLESMVGERLNSIRPIVTKPIAIASKATQAAPNQSAQAASSSNSSAPLDLKSALQLAERTVVSINGGSGVIVGKQTKGGKVEFTILTNAHVAFADGHPNKLPINFGKQSFTGVTVKGDAKWEKNNKPDLAVVRVVVDKDSFAAKNFEPAKLAQTEPTKSTVIFQAGYPYDGGHDLQGVARSSTSKGLIVHPGEIDRDLNPNKQPSTEIIGGYGLGMTANLGQGSSGGAVFNRKGELVGIAGQSGGWINAPGLVNGQKYKEVHQGRSSNYLIPPEFFRSFISK